jgi:hypothetical protein
LPVIPVRDNSKDTADFLSGVLETDLEMVEEANESDSCKEELEDAGDKEGQ